MSAPARIEPSTDPSRPGVFQGTRTRALACIWMAALSLILPDLTAGVDAQAPQPAPLPTTGREVPALRAFDAAVRSLMEHHDVPGASLAVARDGRLVLVRGYGYADTAAREAVRPDHRFRIASVSKPLTAAGILKLVEDGRLRLEDHPFEILGHLAPRDGPTDPRLREITVRQLLRHRGGFDRRQSLDPTLVPGAVAERLGVDPPVGVDQVIHFMMGHPLDFDPGTRTAYSNFGYAVLGRILEEVTGRTYQAFVRETVLRPAEAESMELGHAFPEHRPEDEVSYYHPPPPGRVPAIPPRDGKVRLPDGGFDLEIMAAHGGWIATPADLLRFLTAVDGSGSRPDILSEATVRRMTAPPGTRTGDDAYWAMGWRVRPATGGRPEAWWHGGDLPGTTAHLMRSGSTAWALLLNRSPWDRRAQSTIRRTLEEAAGTVASWPDHDLFGLTDSAAASGPGRDGGRPAVTSTAGDAQCPVTEPDFRTVIRLLARWADRKRQLDDVPGLVLGLACGPDVTWTRGFGTADREVGLAATDTTPFRIASVTKVFTALAVLQLRDDGRLVLDDPVTRHLPWFELENSTEMPAVTVRHLLTHTSGLPTNSAATDFNRMTQPTAEQLRSVLPNQRLLFAPGSDENYSNLGFAVLGQIIESVSGRSYRDYMAGRVFGPLGLERTAAHPSPDLPQANGYHLPRPGVPRRPADFLHLAAFTPAGGMATTAADMVRFLSFLLAPETTPGVIATETLREMQRVHHRVDPARGGSGLAWAVEQDAGTHEIYHGGGLPTQTSHLRVDLRHGFGVMVLANAEDADPTAYAQEALALLRRAADTARAGAGEPKEGPSIEELGRYIGRYRFQERELWVVATAGGLSLINPVADRPSRTLVRLFPAGEHRFRLGGSVLGGGAEGQAVEFVVEEDGGDILRLKLPSLMYRRAGALRSGP